MDDIYHRLKSRVGHTESNKLKHSFGGESFTFKDWYAYVGAPALVFAILMLSKPCFITETIVDKVGKEKKSIKWAQAIVYSVIIGIIIDIALYGLFFRKCKK